jgi:nicotinate-nucleotide pyrophosphorylase (carboxylating)
VSNRPSLERSAVERIVSLALQEDLGAGDVTTDALIPPSLQGRGTLIAKAPGVLAGIEVAGLVFQKVDAAVQYTPKLSDTAPVQPGSVLATVAGPLASILKAERTALNLLQRMSGIATETARYVEAVKGLPVRILDTRKTAPGLRLLDKYAVRAGGGHNHRFNLSDGVLIKDNHIAGLRGQGLTLADVVRRARERVPHTLKVQVEVQSLAEAQEAAQAGADALLLDNMPLEEMRKVAQALRLRSEPALSLPKGQALKGQVLLEASGGITLETVRKVAQTGVQLISVGALTHSVRTLDISLEVAPQSTGPRRR